jgi:serine/threonine protein kinase
MVLVSRPDPQRIGPYSVISRLGAGAMGQVFLARSTAGRLVAVKTIRPELAEEEGFRTRFAQEFAAARRVSGMFTAAVVDADPDAEVPWLATAYVPAPSLRRMVQVCGPLPPSAVRWLAAGCAEALESIHRAGLVHMDLKPANVLVGMDGPRVIDFGVARAAARIGFGRDSGAKGRGTVGTPAYMAPEQAQDPTQVSVASDVFSLGATLVYAATGHAPYLGETTADVLVLLATEPPDLAGLPEELTDLVTECLDRTPRQRPSPAALLGRLGEFTEEPSYLPEAALDLIEQYQHPSSRPLDSEQTDPSIPALPASAKPEVPAPSFPSWKRLRRLPSWAAWAAGGAALVAGGVILGASLADSGTPAPSQFTIGAGPPPVDLGPACGSSPAINGVPALCVNQIQGSPSTVFTVRSSGFKPGTSLTLAVIFYPPPASGVPPSPQTMRTLTVTANGQVKLGQLQLGLYKVAAPGQGAHTAFRVVPPGAP